HFILCITNQKQKRKAITYFLPTGLHKLFFSPLSIHKYKYVNICEDSEGKYPNMFEFGDELTIESYRIPWLIWIQILVLFLLIFLLYCFNLFASDLSDTTTNTSTASPSRVSHLDKQLVKHNTTTITNCLQNTQVRGDRSIKGEIRTGTSNILRGDNVTQSDDSSSMDTNFIGFHPCHYFRLAKLAFLKCLGLDPNYDCSSTAHHTRER
ncbi:hypothetical protein CFOL_v3_33332, partial [Cephalotus follicularis]